ncbi:NAD-dependent protein deacetylase sirtuin [Acrasis kona]|uniref:NAD-dependent protein deacetylase sirtuin n=1 Tax=Acrasis kona TaxID=1008807 RepID=A0AAW2YUK8_9EUKA
MEGEEYDYEASLTKCAEHLAGAERVVVFTGAGISAESGIDTFRSGGGLWTGMVGKVVLGIFGTPFGWKWLPQFAWSQYVDKFYNPIKNAVPNDGHKALVELEEMFKGKFCIITQNVDGLHQKAGSDPSNVFEVHGTVKRSICVKNRHVYESFESEELPRTSPICKVDRCGSTLRPDCVLFTESLPMDEWMNSEDGVNRLRQGDVLLIVGTSANVYPAAGLPKLAARRGAHLIDVNLEPTPFKQCQNYNFLGKGAGTSLPALLAKLRGLKPM